MVILMKRINEIHCKLNKNALLINKSNVEVLNIEINIYGFSVLHKKQTAILIKTIKWNTNIKYALENNRNKSCNNNKLESAIENCEN